MRRTIAALALLAACSDTKPVDPKTADSCAAEGKLLEAGACVEPAHYGAPLWSTCPNEQHGTNETLSEKAAYYDDIATRLHLHPQLGFVLNVTLKEGVDEKTATVADVERFQSGENDGLWSALYLTSQAYRYAVTRDPAVLATIRVMLDAEAKRMRITGVPGIFTRQYIPPDVQGISCPTDQAHYITDLEKDDNRWVKIEDDGCVSYVDRETMAWTKSEHCGLGEFAGYCFLDNVSKDEYAGHMLALGALYKYVDDPEVQRITRELLTQVGDHLVDNELQLVDWDRRITEHGRFSPVAFDDFPGFNAAMAMAYVGAAKVASQSAELTDFYDRCLLQRSGGADCLGFTDPDPFTSYLEAAGMYVGPEGCGSNYNNVSMHLLTLHTLLWFEHDKKTRAEIQHSLEADVMKKSGEPRAIIGQHNALFDFIWAAGKKLGEGSDGPAYDAVEDGICQLKQYRASQASPSITLDPVRHAPYCKDRFDRDSSQHARETYERCAATFVWWGDPYSLSVCSEDLRDVHQPSGYLLPYWMGRYYGFIPADL
jgi:hypothetical protein